MASPGATGIVVTGASKSPGATGTVVTGTGGQLLSPTEGAKRPALGPNCNVASLSSASSVIQSGNLRQQWNSFVGLHTAPTKATNYDNVLL
mmetsp:Transcript_70982/g.140958  ORF Transcript_70982/g.140958 Transcript_70982/m.140958 type:complete len:91 (-) Transcript_70982:2-274(-)